MRLLEVGLIHLLNVCVELCSLQRRDCEEPQLSSGKLEVVGGTGNAQRTWHGLAF